MEKQDYSKELSAGPVQATVTKQGTFNKDGASVAKPGMKDSSIVGPAMTNGPFEVNFAKKGSDGNLAKKAEFTTKEDHSLYSNSGK